jgi:hypothetical protein
VGEDPGRLLGQDLRRIDDLGLQMHLLSNAVAVYLLDWMPNYSIQSATSSEKVNATILNVAA